MRLDWKTCSQARLSRDPRFDGKFFIGVLTSGVYCRSICPARTSNESNVRYFVTAAAASEAGFRPCLRCRPECSPGTPAWFGTSNTVSRALRLIDESALEQDGIETLAERLGISARHLRRLFLKHLGASPSAVAHTRRLHFAKKLIDETTLQMGHVAIASGFGGVRRFNEAIRQTYHRTPTQIRRFARQTKPQPENEYHFQLCFRPPYQWNAMLAFLAGRAIPGVEFAKAGVYGRSIFLNGRPGYFEVSLNKSKQALAVRIQFDKPQWLFFIIERIRRMFDLNADPQSISVALHKDPLLRQSLKANPGIRVPGCWNSFELATRAILGQQITLKGATTLSGRLVTAFGHKFSVANNLTHLFPEPEVLAGAKLENIGLPKARAATIRALARAVCDGRISFEATDGIDQFTTQLCELPGIGKWTAQYVAMRALGDPDGFPAGDVGLLRASGLRNSRELERSAEAWRPWRAYAAMHLWNAKRQSP